MTEVEKQFAEHCVRQILEQRDEIVKAFIAKYGFEPDRAIQVEERTATGFRWSIHQMSSAEFEARQAKAVRALTEKAPAVYDYRREGT